MSSPNHTLGFMHIHEKFDNPRKNFAFFFKEDIEDMVLPGHKDVVGNNYTFGFPRIGTKRFLQWTNEIDCIFTIFRDVYVGFSGIVSDGHALVKSKNTTGPEFIYYAWKGHVVKHVMTGISIHHNYNIFGHFIADCLYPLMALPIEFLKSSTIIHADESSFVKEFFALLDIADNVIYINHEDWVHCDSLISATHPMPHVVHFGTLPFKLNQFMRKKLNLESIEPTKYGFIKRTASTRVILNLDECMMTLKAKVPNVDWQVFNENINDLVDSAKLHASMKMYGNVCGSNTHKVIFMSPKAIVVFVNTALWDYSVYLPPASIGMKIVWFMTKDWYHYSNHTVDPLRFAKAFEAAAYYAENERWPDTFMYNAFIDVL